MMVVENLGYLSARIIDLSVSSIAVMSDQLRNNRVF
jgi:hypothetical protein